MLRTAGNLKGVTIEAMDGDIGSVQDLYFDDQTWTVRYVVVDTGTWLPGRQVLISPFAFQVVQGASRLRTSLTKEQVRDSPSIDSGSSCRPAARDRVLAVLRLSLLLARPVSLGRSGVSRAAADTAAAERPRAGHTRS